MAENEPPAGASCRRLSSLEFFLGRRRPLEFLDRLGSWPGDVAQAQIGRRHVTLLKHPDLIQQLLVSHAAQTEKGRTAERALFFEFLGNGLLNSRGAEHRRQRRLMLPAFHHQRLAAYAGIMTQATDRAMATWKSGEVREINGEMMALTARIVGQTLFSTDAGETADVVAKGFNELTASLNRLTLPGARWLLRSPLPFARRLRHVQGTLDGTVRSLIKQRRADGADTGDLLSMLLLAKDAENPAEHLSDDEIRDQLMGLLFAGHETTANALTWILWLLAQHPRIQAQLQAELDQPPSDSSQGPAARWPFAAQIVSEALRLYPPVWTIGRVALADLEFAGVKAPANSLLVASQWRTHRDARWFPEPDSFRPERWTAEMRRTLPRFAYFPFGGGARSCLGENFAWSELVLVTAAIARRWALEPRSPNDAVQPQARITLHPDRPVYLRLSRRQ